jgi:hypothetical protein
MAERWSDIRLAIYLHAIRSLKVGTDNTWNAAVLTPRGGPLTMKRSGLELHMSKQEFLKYRPLRCRESRGHSP